MLDEIEQGFFWGRSHGGHYFKAAGKWVCATGDRNSAVARAWLLEPEGKQGWTVVLDQYADEEDNRWANPYVVGADRQLSYDEAEQVAYIFITEGEVGFDFHRGIAFSLNGYFENGKLWAETTERLSTRRLVIMRKDGDGWYAHGGDEMWDPNMETFRSGGGTFRFPARGTLGFEAVRQTAYDWLVQPVLEGTLKEQAAA